MVKSTITDNYTLGFQIIRVTVHEYMTLRVKRFVMEQEIALMW